MAKSFKKPVSAAEPAKKTSEKDFLDFLEQDRQAPPPQPAIPRTGAGKPATDKKQTSGNNTGNTSNIKPSEGTSVTNSIGVTPAITEKNSEAADVRQTFIVGSHYLGRLKDYVHTRRAAGQYDYTQKQALHEALDLLFATAAIEPRPVHIREQEESRRQRIRRGLPK